MLDPRGPRFAAALTTVVLIIVLVFGAGWLALAQAAIFAVTALAPRYGPYALIYRRAIAPRLGPPGDLEPAAPVRFAQLVGLCFAVVAAFGYLSSATLLGAVAAGGALLAAFLNAVFGLCLGCEMYLVLRRLTGRLGHSSN